MTTEHIQVITDLREQVAQLESSNSRFQETLRTFVDQPSPGEWLLAHGEAWKQQSTINVELLMCIRTVAGWHARDMELHKEIDVLHDTIENLQEGHD